MVHHSNASVEKLVVKKVIFRRQQEIRYVYCPLWHLVFETDRKKLHQNCSLLGEGLVFSLCNVLKSSVKASSCVEICAITLFFTLVLQKNNTENIKENLYA